MAKKEEIILGSGDLYYMEFDGTNIPEDTVLEVEEKRAGHIRGGASIEYKPSFYEASDDFKRVTKSVLTEEVATMKLGLITWAENVLEALISTARKGSGAEYQKRRARPDGHYRAGTNGVQRSCNHGTAATGKGNGSDGGKGVQRWTRD